MPDVKTLGEVVHADVLVIGGGFAGIWAAIRARDFVNNVVLVDKAQVAKTGCSTFAAGVQLCPLPDDDLGLWKKEIVERGDFFPNQEWVDIFLQNQIERVKDYQEWGAPLEKDEKGRIARILGRGHVNTRLFQFHGQKLMGFLKQKALNKGIHLLERVMVTDLLTTDGKFPTHGAVIGAFGLDTRKAKISIFKASSVVLANGPIGNKNQALIPNCTGDGVAAAFRAGAELTNMEFCTAGNITAWERKGNAPGINMIQGHGSHFINALGERFMSKYDPALMERSLLHTLCMGFAKEALEGRGPIYVDMRHLSKETFAKFERVIPLTMHFWKELGIDVTKQPVQCTPMWRLSNITGQGGLHVDKGCRTSIPGLYAAGAVARIPVQGIYAVGGAATSGCNVMGYIAGENAAREADLAKKLTVDFDQVEKLKNSVLSPLNIKDGLKAEELFSSLDENTVPAKYGMFKSQERILKVLFWIEKMKEGQAKLSAPDVHELVKANEFKNYLLCAELVFRAALERKESRQYHYREEYPYIDNIDWLKLIVLKREKQGLSLRYEPIPVEKWGIKPEKLKISHPTQVFIGDE